MRTQEEIGMLSVFMVGALIAILLVIQGYPDYEPEEPIQEIRPINFDYDKCDVSKFSANTPFIIKVKYHEPAIKQDIRIDYQNPESEYVYVYNHMFVGMRSESIDEWIIQISLEFKEDNDEERWALIDYELGNKTRHEVIDDMDDDWCRIFEVSSHDNISYNR